MLRKLLITLEILDKKLKKNKDNFELTNQKNNVNSLIQFELWKMYNGVKYEQIM